MSLTIRHHPGLSDYATTVERMRAFTRERDAQTPDELWLLEHPAVFTLGLAGRAEHLLAPSQIPVIKTERGGQVTHHGPGQVIAYPLLDLRRLGIGVKELVFRIEQALIQTLASYDIDAHRVSGAPGVYVPYPGGHGQFEGLAKIAALGIKISGGCSFHGTALNVAMDLTPFTLIDPCGYQGLRTIDMASLGIQVQAQQVAQKLAERLSAHLG